MKKVYFTSAGGATFTLGNVTDINFSGANNNDQYLFTSAGIPLPEPASIALWLSGLPVLGLARFWRRRRRSLLVTAQG